MYVEGCRESVQFDQGILQYIQDDFVRERQQALGVNSDDLVLRMSAARWQSLILGDIIT